MTFTLPLNVSETDFSPSSNTALPVPASGTRQVLWTDLETPYPPVTGVNVGYSWPGAADAEPMFNPAHVLSIHFYVPTNIGTAVPVEDLCVSDLSAIVAP